MEESQKDRLIVESLARIKNLESKLRCYEHALKDQMEMRMRADAMLAARNNNTTDK